MLSRVIVAAIVIGAGGGTAAQTPVTSQVSRDARLLVQGFENHLRVAIASAGQQMADRARQVTPPGFELGLKFETEIRVRAAILPQGEGVLCMVEVPGIEPNMATLLQLALRLAQPPGIRVGNGASANLTDPPAATSAPLMINPVQEYSDFTHAALVDAMLNNGSSLPITAGQTLTLVVGNVVSPVALNPLAEPERMLYLRIKGEDLIALRQGRITKDDAKKHILEWRY